MTAHVYEIYLWSCDECGEGSEKSFDSHADAIKAAADHDAESRDYHAPATGEPTP